MILPEDNEKITTDVIEEMKQELTIGDKRLVEITDAGLAKIAEGAWDAIQSHGELWKVERFRLARVTIKMLYAKYPALMDEPIESAPEEL